MRVLNRVRKPIVYGFGSTALLAGVLLGHPTGQSQSRSRDSIVTDAISVVVSPYGFAQSTLSVPAGPSVFVVLNRTGFDDINVLLERMPGSGPDGTPVQREFDDVVGRSRPRLVSSVRLTPGTYRLRVAGRPAWVSAIHVN
jgi:hypothetical protein